MADPFEDTPLPPDPANGDLLNTPIDPEHLARVERLAAAAIADQLSSLRALME